MTLYQGLSAMLGLRSVAAEARRIRVERPVFEEAVGEGRGFAARADDDERFAAQSAPRGDLHRLDDLVGEVTHQLRAFTRVAAVTKHHAKARPDAKDLPQRVCDQVI